MKCESSRILILKNKRIYTRILYVCVVIFLMILSQPFQCLSFAATLTINFDNYVSSTNNDYINNFTPGNPDIFSQVTTGGITGGALEPANTGDYGNSYAVFKQKSKNPTGGVMGASLDFKYQGSLVNPNSIDRTCEIWFIAEEGARSINFVIRHSLLLDIASYNWVASNDGIAPTLVLTDGWYRLETRITNVGGQFRDQLHVYAEVFNLGINGTDSPVSIGTVQGTIYDYPFASDQQISVRIAAAKWGGSSLVDNFVDLADSFVSVLYANFASAGIWKWDGTTWTQATPNNPELMVTSGTTLYGSFAGGGIWKWDSYTWTQVTPNNPDLMVATTTTLYGSFARGGIWKYDGTTWTQVTPNNPQLLAASSKNLYGSFAGAGTWKRDGTTWTLTANNNPQLMAASESNFYESITGGGIWKWDGSNWTHVTPNNPQLLIASGENLYGSFTGAGIWKWDGSTWTQTTPNYPEQMVASDSDLYGSFTGGGIWKWDGATWTQVTPNNPASMVLGN